MATTSDRNVLKSLSSSHLELKDPNEDVRGRKVVDAAGKEIGKVDDLVVDEVEHVVRFLRVERGGIFGIGEKHFLVPVDAVGNVDADTVHITRNHEHAAAAPDYDPDLEAADHRRYWGDVYDYWGFAPFWTAGYSYPAFPLTTPNTEEHWRKVDEERWNSD